MEVSAASAPAAPCPRCGGASEHAFDAFDRNRGVSDERFAYRRCTVCRVLWLRDPPADLAAYYPSDYHAFLEPGELAVAAAAEAPRLELITRSVAKGRLVEIGPSQGVFSSTARQAGFDVTTLEMDAHCCEHLREVVGVRAIHTASPQEVLPTLTPSRALVMWHVIEHLPDPWSVLAAIADNLEPGGVLAVGTPNPEGLQARLFRARWVHVDAPRHLTLIPLPALRDEAKKLGLGLVTATTSDSVGLDLNRMGWERSVLNPPALRAKVRFVHTIGGALTAAAAPVERRGLRGAAYTALFRKAA